MAKTERKCRNCDRSLQGHPAQERYCNLACREEAHLIQIGRIKRPPVPGPGQAVCDECWSLYVPGHRMFCSPECRQHRIAWLRGEVSDDLRP